MTVEEWLGKYNRLGIDIWHKKYQVNGESFDEWLDRVSHGWEPMRELIVKKKFLFGGRILANRGVDNGSKKTYSNCYCSSVDDSIEDIFDTAKKVARTFSYGGGIGVDLSKLAPRGAVIHNAAKTTSGAVSFMDLYSLVTGLIGTAGRRGALMLSLSCEHPDLEEFIDVKTNLDKVTYANMSVRITDAFMEAVSGRGKVPEDTSFRLHFTREETGEVIERVVDARELFTKLAQNNWDSAEPGILFWDRIEKWNLLSSTPDFKFAGVNPCGEEPLPNGGACLLGSLNLSEFVIAPHTIGAHFDFAAFEEAVNTAVLAMNDVLDEGIPLHPLQEQRDAATKWRQIGLGVMGVADMFIKLGIKYGSPESIHFSSLVGYALANRAMQTSAELARHRGTYPGCTNISDITSTPYFQFVANDRTKELVGTYGLHNSQILTIAPTGTLSTMIEVSGGAEPIFANSYIRTTKSLHGDKDVDYRVFAGVVDQYMKMYGCEDVEGLPDHFITARDLDYHERIEMQSVWQKYIDASISSTVNMPENATIEDVADLYMLAWKKGLKGVTIFRENCKRAAILNTDKHEAKRSIEIPRGIVMDVPVRQSGEQFKIKTACGSMYVMVSTDDDGNITNCFTSVGNGGCRCNTEATSRMMSLAIRGGIPIEEVVKQLQKSGQCPNWRHAVGEGKGLSRGTSCPSSIANVLKDVLAELQQDDEEEPATEKPVTRFVPKKHEQAPYTKDEYELIYSGICPDCGSSLTNKGGCIECMSCGWSKCT